MNTTFIRTAAILGALAVVLGAFGAHSLEKVLEPKSLQAFETGVRYQFYHALALLAAGMLAERYRTLWAGRLFIAGIIAFSGSLYLLTTRSVTGIESLVWLGPVTPLGGLCFIAGWISLAWSVSSSKSH